MRRIRVVLAFGLAGVVAACAKDRAASAAADSTRIADSMRIVDSVRLALSNDSAASAATRRTAPAPTGPRVEVLVKVTEQVPGLLSQAKLLPIDAQHLAQGKYPEGTVKSGTIERRSGRLVYTFEIQQKGVEGTELVLIGANDGAIVNTIHQAAKP
jgi:uncharacterized membrane protein YkoI